MKRCPQCGRDYTDDTLSFCLDDGTSLLDGPASSDEPATAILPEAEPPSESPTRSYDSPTTASTPEKAFRDTTRTPDSPAMTKKSIIIAAIGIAVLAALGAGGYRMYGSDSGKEIDSIAVMPFVNESGDPDIEYLSDGMTESLIASLSTLPNLSVKARTTVFSYKGKQTSPREIGEELEVQAVLFGRVSGRSEDLRLNLELVDTRNEDVIWSENYDRQQSDLVRLQSEVARDVSAKIRARLSGEEEKKVSETGTVDPKAYQAYLKGLFYWNKRGEDNLKRAIREFEAAIKTDPGYALAYVALAETYSVLASYSSNLHADAIASSRRYADKAIELNPELAGPYAALGQVELQLWNWEKSEENFKKAIELDPNYPTAYHWYTILLRNLGKNDEAASVINRAKELDPMSSIIGINVSYTLLLQNKGAESAENSLKIIELTPDFPQAYETLGFSYLALGQPDRAVQAFEKANSLSDNSYGLGYLGFAYAKAGDEDRAGRVLKELQSRYGKGEAPGKSIAAVHVGLGNLDTAFEWLEKDFEDRNSQLPSFRWEIPFHSVHSDPRYRSLLKRMDLPE